MLKTVVVPAQKTKLRDFWLSPDAKNRRVSVKRSAAGIEFLKRVSRFDNFWPVKWSRCSDLSGEMRK